MTYGFSAYRKLFAELKDQFLDQGQPIVRSGRKAMGLSGEIARLPKGIVSLGFAHPLETLPGLSG